MSPLPIGIGFISLGNVMPKRKPLTAEQRLARNQKQRTRYAKMTPEQRGNGAGPCCVIFARTSAGGASVQNVAALARTSASGASVACRNWHVKARARDCAAFSFRPSSLRSLLSSRSPGTVCAQITLSREFLRREHRSPCQKGMSMMIGERRQRTCLGQSRSAAQ